MAHRTKNNGTAIRSLLSHNQPARKCLTVTRGLYQSRCDIFQLVEARMNEHIDIERSTGYHRQLCDVDQFAEPNGNHANAVCATDRCLDGRQFRKDVRVAVADDRSNVWNAGTVALGWLERPRVDETQSGLRVRPVTAERNSSNSFDDVLLHLTEVVHVESNEGVVAPVDESDSCPVHADVQFVDDGDHHLFDNVESCARDTPRTVEDKHQVEQTATP